MLRQLVDHAGVPETSIYVGDPARNIYKEHYLLWKNEFPEIHYLGNNIYFEELDLEVLGRNSVAISEEDLVFFSDNGSDMPDAISDPLYTIFQEIDYLINIPTMKAHATAGITLSAKNHFGSFTRNWALHLHDGLMKNTDDPERLGYELYRVQTDIMMHELLGGKNLLMIVDGLYPGEDALGVPEKWQSFPFNSDWCSSIFLSLDPVAIESVCHDFLRTEYNGSTIAESRPNWDGVDDYLHQAADSSWWPEGIIYDPDNNGIIIASLGVHEHWNDAINKEYSRNLGIGAGIELIKAFEENVGLSIPDILLDVSVFPNPAKDYVFIESQENNRLSYQIISANGSVVSEGMVAPNTKEQINIQHLAPGIYHIRATNDQAIISFKMIKL